jgi:hydrogenase expression/formation protein HypC
MCLGIPMRIQEIEGGVATAVLGGTTRRIHLDVLDEAVEVGDHVIVHAGFAIHKISKEEARETLNLFRQAGVLSVDPEREGHGIH